MATRGQAINRVASTNKTAVQTMNASLSFSASTDKVSCGSITQSSTMSYSFWLNYTGGTTGMQRIAYTDGSINADFAVGQTLFPGNFVFGSWLNTGIKCPVNKWVYVTAVFNGTSNLLYINGSLVSTRTNTAIISATANIFIGSKVTETFYGKIKDFKLFNKSLNATEALNLMSGINPTDYSTSIVRDFSLNEGAGTTVYSRNNPALTGTITGATWSSDTPTKARNQIGGNLVKNGDLSYVPVVNVAQTTLNWIDGTVGGSSTNNLFGFAVPSGAIASVASATFDTSVTYNNKPSLKLSTIDATGTVIVTNYSTATKQVLIPVLPNTSYTLTAIVKTNNVATNAVKISLRQYTGDVGIISTNNSSFLNGTNDWTMLSVAITTGATARFVSFLLSNSVAGNISDAWFANITLTPTVNTTRNTI